MSGSLKIPPSKSQTLRALIFALLADGQSEILSPLNSPDVEAMLRAIESLGAKVFRFPDKLVIEGTRGHIQHPENVINAGNSGIVYRFITALCALQKKGLAIISGDASIRNQRPIFPLLNAIQMLGGTAFSTRPQGGAPVLVQGPLVPGKVTLDGRDSQPVSALLIACAIAPGPFEILVKNLGERPWLDLTLDWLKRMGCTIQEISEGHFGLKGGDHIQAFRYEVPSDFSSASYPIAAAIITGSQIAIEGLDYEDKQGDKALIDALIDLGAALDKKERSLTVRGQRSLRGGELNILPYVDALPLLALIGCFCQNPLTLTGVAICRQKESDRVASIAKELRKMGAKVEESFDSMTIYPSTLTAAKVESHKDHRIALSLAVAAMSCSGESEIQGWECTQKSYPQFVQDLQTLGAQIV